MSQGRRDHFYVAMVIYTSRRRDGDFEGWVFFDNGDGREYRESNDITSVVAKDGRRVGADYHFRGTYDVVLDSDVGGANDERGAGRHDGETRLYTFEFRREPASGDAKDVEIGEETTLDIEYGWSSYQAAQRREARVKRHRTAVGWSPILPIPPLGCCGAASDSGTESDLQARLTGICTSFFSMTDATSRWVNDPARALDEIWNGIVSNTEPITGTNASF